MANYTLSKTGAQIDADLQLIEEGIIDLFSEESTYYVNDMVNYNGGFYKCVNEISTPGPFDPNDWEGFMVLDYFYKGVTISITDLIQDATKLTAIGTALTPTTNTDAYIKMQYDDNVLADIDTYWIDFIDIDVSAITQDDTTLRFYKANYGDQIATPKYICTLTLEDTNDASYLGSVIMSLDTQNVHGLSIIVEAHTATIITPVE